MFRKYLPKIFLFMMVLTSPLSLNAQTWTSQTIPAASTVRAIHFLDVQNGWAAGYDGVIYHTTNGGTDWASQTSTIAERLVAIRFVDANYGWANAGLRVLRTTDGGSAWNSMTGLDPNAAIFRNTIFPVSSTVAWSTAQASGLRWFYRYTATSATAVTEQTFGLISSSAQLIDLWFIDADNGWSVGTNGQIWKIGSASSGSPTFTNQTNTGVTSSTLRGIHMLDANNGWAVGDLGTIIKTTNGGSNWAAVTSGITTALRDVYLYDMSNAIVVGDGGVIRSTTDGGANWTSHTSGVSTILWSVFFVNAGTGFVTGGDFTTSSNGVILSVGDFALPVNGFTLTAENNRFVTTLFWKTAAEVNNYGFEVERKELIHRSIGSLNQSADESINQWTKIGFVEGHGTTNAPKSYTFIDGSAQGTFVYRLKQIDRDGSFEYSNQVEVTAAAPAEFTLMQNHPNPFNPATSINYTLPVAGHVSLKIYDMLGKEVATLVNGMQDAGAKIAKFDASQLPSGMYFYTLRTQNFSATKKMLLVK